MNGGRAGQGRAGVSRRGLLTGLGAAGIAGAAGAAGLATGGLIERETTAQGDTARELSLGRSAPEEGRPPALLTPTPAHVHVVAVDLRAERPEQVSQQARTVLRLWGEQARGLHEHGLAEIVEGAPTQGLRPASLGITLGLGASLLERAGLAERRPEPLADLPEFASDHLDPALCGGDLMLHVGAEDPLVVSAVVEHLLGIAREQALVRWSLPGFQRAAATAADPSATPRNLMGQVDGTVNPHPDQAQFGPQVLAAHPDGAASWMDGGTYVVVRRIRMLLDDWFDLEPHQRERVVGRRLSDGAPLGGDREDALPDLAARGDDGEPVIAANAHIRLASPERTLGARMLRRGFSYDLGWSGGRREAGLLFTAWQADPRTGFTAVQRELDEGGDALNTYIRHEGSAVFAVPPVRENQPHPAHDLW
ncbi:Dyp-type peroxidase [Nocardiopsis metallicus]|uniref:Dye decolorizing peroxidase n=1 Tax=Nocardiopsis metallicus TaxID=179819 RepID=A0A840W1W1_9ACTN|nr:Dyp-type peroxidase [Nocardiopsis metallicus]MBB5490052.1 dye decolorizing peroxidase [Nocardiopsis metallicus]